jgi:hypothetical protein
MIILVFHLKHLALEAPLDRRLDRLNLRGISPRTITLSIASELEQETG